MGVAARQQHDVAASHALDVLANRDHQLQLAVLDDVQSSGTLKTNREASGWRVRDDAIAVQSNVCEQLREQIALPTTRDEAEPVACWVHRRDVGDSKLGYVAHERRTGSDAKGCACVVVDEHGLASEREMRVRVATAIAPAAPRPGFSCATPSITTPDRPSRSALRMSNKFLSDIDGSSRTSMVPLGHRWFLSDIDGSSRTSMSALRRRIGSRRRDVPRALTGPQILLRSARRASPRAPACELVAPGQSRPRVGDSVAVMATPSLYEIAHPQAQPRHPVPL
jgi:hypothetical protein